MGLSWTYVYDLALEGAFGITFEMDDIIDFSSYKTGRNFKYKVNIS